jgi:hypothetical protein
MVAELFLESHQIDAFKNACTMLNTLFGIMCTAGTGTGKSYIAMALALYYKYHMLIICPPDARINWEELIAHYGISATIITYAALAGKSGIMSHPYLVQSADKKYYATPALSELIKKKVLIVFDESQVAKNTKSLTSKACHALTKEVIKCNNGSRVLTLSATPVDKEIYIESVCKLTGIITAETLFHYDPGHRDYHMKGYGYDQLYEFCYKINPARTKELYPQALKASTIRDSAFKLFVEIAKHKMAFTMPNPVINAKLVTMTMFYKMQHDDLAHLKQGLQDLKEAVQYDPQTGTILYKKDGLGKIIKSMMLMERSKINLFCRLITETLNYVDNSKVVMYVWHDDTVEILMDRLKKYKPLRCDGKVSQKERHHNRTLFQADNNEYRLIIAKPTSFGRAIGLHDVNGNGTRPRFTYINPNFHFNHIIQAAGRTYRVGTKSNTHIYLTYTADNDESNVINALSKKSEITRQCLAVLDKDYTIKEYVIKDENDDDTVEEEDLPEYIPFVDKWNCHYEN